MFTYSVFWNNQYTLRILLYYDEIEIKNPLGDASGVYKVAQWYFSILNLTRRHNSSLNNIFSLASAFSSDVNKYGFNRILEPIIKDLKFFEKNMVSRLKTKLILHRLLK